MSNLIPRGFDSFAINYEQALRQGLSATGETKDYFAIARVRWLKKELASRNHHPKRVLDFGCGTGTSTPLLFSILGATDALGVDVSAESLKVAEKNCSSVGPVKFGSAETIPPAGNIDLAFCNGVFHHIALKDRPDSMRYVFDSLCAGGLFAFWENNPWNPGTRYVMSHIPFDHDAITLSPPQAARLAKATGFEILATRFLFFFPKSLEWMRWMEPMLQRVPLGGQYIVLARKPGNDSP